MELRCAHQEYHWGRPGLKSAVAQLVAAVHDDVNISETSPYAELWMGTHPNGPSRLAGSGQSLQEWIAQNPDCLGEKVLAKFGSQLPYLFKVLSVNTALSIQAHPSKSHAEELHAARPDLYKDSNHKPEMALALTPFEALCGFRPIKEIQNFLKIVPELAAAIGPEQTAQLLSADPQSPAASQHLKQCVHTLMTSQPEDISRHLDSLAVRLRAVGGGSDGAVPCELLLRLQTQYPGDVGVFWCLLLNYLTLQPGEALFLGPNEPHAYLSGDCIECMACSDNVVRAGLTPKFKDVPTLVEMLTYQSAAAQEKLFQPLSSGTVEVFNPPVPDFSVAKIQYRPPAPDCQFSVPVRDSASILLVVGGAATSGATVLRRGTVLFLPANQALQLQLSSGEELLMFQAFCTL